MLVDALYSYADCRNVATTGIEDSKDTCTGEDAGGCPVLLTTYLNGISIH